MSIQKNILELYAVHDNFLTVVLTEKNLGGDLTKEPYTKKRDPEEIYFDAHKKEKETREIPKKIETYLNSVGTLLDGSFYGINQSDGTELTYHIDGNTAKINISPLCAGRDYGDSEGIDWTVFGYRIHSNSVGKGSKKVLSDFMDRLAKLGFKEIDGKEFGNYSGYRVQSF